MAIEPIVFGKELRPSTVEAINKINEIVTAVNLLNPAVVDQLTKDVEALKVTTAATEKKASANESAINTVKSVQQQHTTDIDKVKVTLYTPLASPDTDPSKR